VSDLRKYHKSLEQHAANQDLHMNPDWDVVQPLLEGLIENGKRHGLRTCPCRFAIGELEKDRDIVCPCVYAKPDIEEFGACYCWLFVSKDWAENRIPHVQIPERRPPEKSLDF